MEISQDIRFTPAADGTSIAYAATGSGSPLIKAANWLSHLEYDLESPVWRPYLDALSTRFTMTRYDGRGTGLSDRPVEGFDFDHIVSDLEAVVEVADVDRFALLGVSQGGPVAIEYAARHPDRVTHLVLVGAFARGHLRRNDADSEKQHQLFRQLVEVGWSTDDPTFRRVFTSLLIPDGTARQHQWFDELIRRSTSGDSAQALMEAFSSVDITEQARKVSCPTLVLHSRGDRRVPFDEGRLVASLIPGARLVQLDSENHLPFETEAAWSVLVSELFGFVLANHEQRVHRTEGWAAMLMTDIVDSTRMVSAIGDEAWSAVIRWHDRTLEQLITEGGGKVANNTGDGFLATFDELHAAIDCAIAIQAALAAHRRSAGYAPRVRMGVNAGPITRGPDSLSGLEIHRTARIAASAGGDEILIDASLADEASSSFALGELRVIPAKGIEDQVGVQQVVWR